MKKKEPPANDSRYQFAKTCQHCNDTADSFNGYVSTYCHAKQMHLFGFEDRLDVCSECQFYRQRTQS